MPLSTVRAALLGPSHVLRMCYRLQMCRIDTELVLTRVIQFHAVRYRPDKKNIRNAMSTCPITAMHATPILVPILTAVAGTRPYPVLPFLPRAREKVCS